MNRWRWQRVLDVDRFGNLPNGLRRFQFGRLDPLQFKINARIDRTIPFRQHDRIEVVAKFFRPEYLIDIDRRRAGLRDPPQHAGDQRLPERALRSDESTFDPSAEFRELPADPSSPP